MSIIKESLIYMIFCIVWKDIRESKTFAVLSRIGRWIVREITGSLLFAWATGQDNEQPQKSRLFRKLHMLVWKLFHALRLDRLMHGSIFMNTLLWCALAMILAPLVPTIVLLALVLASFLSLLCTFGNSKQQELAYSPVNKWMYLYAVVYLLAVVTSVSVSGSLYVGALTVFFLLFYTVLTTVIRKWSQLHMLLVGMLGAGVLVALYGFWQYVHPTEYAAAWVDSDMFSSITARVYSTLANPNVLGIYLLLVIPICAALMLSAPGKLKKILYAVAGVLLIGCLMLTYSRGCYLALLFEIAIFLVLLDYRFLFLGIVALLLCPLYLPDTIIDRFSSIGNLGDSSTAYRVNIWIGTLRMLKDYWLCGIGPGEGAFNVIYPSYGLSAIEAPHAHNLFLQITCDAGIVGLAVFVLLIISFLRTCCTAMKKERHRDAKLFQIAAVSGCLGFLLEGMTDYAFYNYRVMFLFWGFLGLGVLFAKADKLKEADLGGERLWHEMPEGRRPRLRVLNIISDTNIGGAGRCLINFLKYYDRARYDVGIILPKGSELAEECRKLDAYVIEADIEGDRSLDPRAIPVLRAMVAAAEPDIVHTHGSMSGRIAARGSHAKLIYTRHSAFPIPDNMKHGARHQVNRLINELYADRIIAVSKANEENLIDTGVRPEQIDTMMNGVEPVTRASAAEQQRWRERLGLSEQDFVIGILARLEEYKGHLLLVEAAGQLKKEGYPIKVLIAGNGSFEATIRAKIQELGLEDTVLLLGFTRQVSEFLSILDLQVNCSFGTEASSLAMLEGFSIGVPAVVSNYGGNPWQVFGGQNGLLFESKNSADLARCLRRLMDDRDLLRAMSKRAQEIYEERFTGQIFARNIEAVYERVLEK
ncbi:MAG: glycosyltransferase [Eubacteriales bacterium]|nr:glycosyltransferase [Eubacteriales bacterium]